MLGVASENSRGRKEAMSNRVSFTRLIDTIELSERECFDS